LPDKRTGEQHARRPDERCREGGRWNGGWRGYQVWVTALLSLNFGILFFDRNALNFLMPFVQPDLGLSNTQVGLFSSALSLTWALSGFASAAFQTGWARKRPWSSSPRWRSACARWFRALPLRS
jgi:sugar phosphate permease